MNGGTSLIMIELIFNHADDGATWKAVMEAADVP
jgi:hypothetical protein